MEIGWGLTAVHGGDDGSERWARRRRQIATLWRDAASAVARDGWVFHRGVLSRESGEGNLGVLVSRADWFGYDLPGTHIFPFIASAAVARAFGMSWPARGRAETAPEHLSLPSIELAVTDDEQRVRSRPPYSVGPVGEVAILDRGSAPSWLRASVAAAVDWIDAHLTDAQLLAAYLDGPEQMGFMAMRNAAVLARILGREDLMPDLVRLSEAAGSAASRGAGARTMRRRTRIEAKIQSCGATGALSAFSTRCPRRLIQRSTRRPIARRGDCAHLAALQPGLPRSPPPSSRRSSKRCGDGRPASDAFTPAVHSPVLGRE